MMNRTGESELLPVEKVIPQLIEALNSVGMAVLEAPPGAGKTTRVPIALVGCDWLKGQRVLVLEPRRLAARAAATYMARILGENVGDTVGYRVRGESCVSAGTKIEVITEGILTRMISADPTLDGVGVVVFDEYHERSMAADLGLALALRSRDIIRPDLRILIMSATLDGSRLADFMSSDVLSVPLIKSMGQMYPVDIEYLPIRHSMSLEAHVSVVVQKALKENEGDVLVFLPGVREIRRAADILTSSMVGSYGSDVVVHELFGNMSLSDQDAAIAVAPAGSRKVVLSTSIAETSLTIQGIRVVVDSGYSRISRHDSRLGFSKLDTVKSSIASATQRAGRAGRLSPGKCYRLWDENENLSRLQYDRPEIQDADLTALALELADSGVEHVSELEWIDSPSPLPMASAQQLLRMLNAIDENNRITDHGRLMVDLPVHPRLSHMLIQAKRSGLAHTAAAVASLLEERDIMSSQGVIPSADMTLRVEILIDGRSEDNANCDMAQVRRVRHNYKELLRRMEVRSHKDNDHEDAVGKVLLDAYPDRLAKRRVGSKTKYLLRNGSGVVIADGDALGSNEWLAVADLSGQSPNYRIARAAPVDLDYVKKNFQKDIDSDKLIAYDASLDRIVGKERNTIGSLEIDSYVLNSISSDDVQRILLLEIKKRGISVLPWSKSAVSLRERMAFLRYHDSAWPDVSDAALTDSAELWLDGYWDGIKSISSISSDSIINALKGLLDWKQLAQIDVLAPVNIEVPSGSRIVIDWSNVESPVLAVRLQEIFGWYKTPTVMDGRVELTMHILSPAFRPVQVTKDLNGFWNDGYFNVRKELRGRYPRHYWPDDPFSAVATRRTRPK